MSVKWIRICGCAFVKLSAFADQRRRFHYADPLYAIALAPDGPADKFSAKHGAPEKSHFRFQWLSANSLLGIIIIIYHIVIVLLGLRMPQDVGHILGEGLGELIYGARWQIRTFDDDLNGTAYAVIDGELGFKLVPWTPSIEKHLGRHISGITRSNGGVAWNLGRERGIGL
ncbi:DUF3363 domain-containing protein [Yoonia algicola]|uniref:DUF3363 domain-containing protein n=1 Tax=Yoonia algicola TaxID=3137368 RepID=A0AAN0M506_9RHOB